MNDIIRNVLDSLNLRKLCSEIQTNFEKYPLITLKFYSLLLIVKLLILEANMCMNMLASFHYICAMF